MPDHERPLETTNTRRGVLSSVAGTGVAAALGMIASNRAATTATATDSFDELLLGSFESTLDEWEADGDVALSRASRSDRPVAVTEGEYALEAAVDGDSAPAISRPIVDLDLDLDLDLSTYPYFVADVVPGRIDGTDAPVAFRFRLYRAADLLEDWTARDPAAESDPVTVPQATPGHVYWDASDVDADLLDAASRLEIAWYPADRDPASSDGSFAYRGNVVFDAIRATASVDPVGRARLAATMRDLQFDHGAYVRTEVTEAFDDGETGRFVFADGTTEPYRFEILAADRYLFTVAGTEIQFGAGWS